VLREEYFCRECVYSCIMSRNNEKCPFCIKQRELAKQMKKILEELMKRVEANMMLVVMNCTR
jgi:hypothetical protein